MYFTETEAPEVNATTQSVEGEQNAEWFEEMLDQYDVSNPKRGDIIEGEVLRVGEDAILVDVGLKRTAIVPSRDIGNLSDEVLENLSEGDKIKVYVLSPPEGDQDLLVSLSKGLEHENWEDAQRYLENGETLDLKVIGHNRGGLLVRFKSLRGFLPYSQVPELRRLRDRKRAEEIKHELIGTEIPVKVIEVNSQRRRLIVSAQSAQEGRREQRLKELEIGQIITGPVVNIVKFGIFVDLDGVDGLVHISKLDWQRVDHPSDLFKVGDEVTVKVTSVDVERERVSLDRKSLLPSPWTVFADEHKPGEVLEGRVTNVVDFGAFVELVDGVEGLVHVSELGYSAPGSPTDVVKPEENVLVRILDIDPERERISLSMRQVPLESQLNWSLQNMEAEAAREEAEAGPEPEAEEPVSEAETEAQTETEDQAEPEAQAEPETQQEPEAQVEPEAQAEPEEQETATEQPAPQAEAEAVAETGDEVNPQAAEQPVQAEEEAQTESEVPVEVEAQAETETSEAEEPVEEEVVAG